LLDKGNTLSKSFGFTGIPSLYVFDGNGALQLAMPGYDPDQEGKLAQATEAALAVTPSNTTGVNTPVLSKAPASKERPVKKAKP
jgi:hypothetical protein